MKTTRNKYYIGNLVFLFSLFILCLNDHFFKSTFANELTGKLSDMAGIVILPLLIVYLFPGLKRYALVTSALLFVFWKSPFSQPLIDGYNKFAIIETSRVIDYTDLYVLPLLIIPGIILHRIDRLDFIKIKKVNPLLVLMPTAFALMATSPPPSFYYTRSDGNLTCHECELTVSFSQDEIVERLKQKDIVFDSIAPLDTAISQRFSYLKKQNTHVYRLNRLIIENDTLNNLDFSMRTVKNEKTRIYFNGMQVSQDISDYKLEKDLRNYYSKILFRALKEKLKE